MPVSSLCNVVSSTSISSLGWFDGLGSGMKENVVLELQTMVSYLCIIFKKKIILMRAKK